MPKKTAPAAPVARMTLPLTALRTEHNIRHHLQIGDGWLINSVRENGVISPLVVEPAADAPGVFDVIQGKRRLAAACAAELTEVPVYVVDPAQRTAGMQYIEMIVENAEEGRKSLSALEEADALFLATESGMTEAAVVRRSGRSAEQVAQSLTAARTVGDRTREALAESDAYELDLAVLSVLGEFDDDPDAVARLLDAHGKGLFEHQVTAERDAIEEREARNVVREELATAGIRLIEPEELEEGVELEPLEFLWDKEGNPLTEDGHAACPGHAVSWEEVSDTPDELYAGCTDWQGNGHLDHPHGEETEEATDDAEEESALRPPHDQDDDEDQDDEDDAPAPRPAPAPAPVKPKPDGMAHAVKLAGNKAYRAALKTRRAWVKEFLQRKTAPKTLAGWVTEQLFICPPEVEKWAGDVPRVALLAEFLGENKSVKAKERAKWIPAGASPGKLALMNFAVLAASHEKRLDQVQTWRTDKPSWDTEEIRDGARTYLSFLSTTGYTLSPVEKAIVDNVTFHPSGEPEESEADDGQDEQAEGSDEQADAPNAEEPEEEAPQESADPDDGPLPGEPPAVDPEDGGAQEEPDEAQEDGPPQDAPQE
ncbi:ParB N-terminal domain-containing protein [Streptomyces sp. NPDC051561]|uniref:ParB/RepB/Spo0J family partition protein n=1 Tax=Streptomyces sp. NPDC051561 TaxID=3365658 RepID=UPI0037ABEC95